MRATWILVPLLFGCLAASSAKAFTVTSLIDSVTAIANDGTLRGAVLASNAGAGGATIDFNVPAGGTITLTAGELALTQSVTITGPTSMAITISGNNASRIFNVASGITVGVANLNLTNGRAANGASGANGIGPPAFIPATAGLPGANGGAILNAGTLTLTSCVVSACRAGTGGTGGDGYADTRGTSQARGGDGVAGGSGGAGGAIYSTGTAAVVRCTVMNCSAGVGGTGGNGGYGTVYGGWGSTGGLGGAAGAVWAASGTLTLDTSTVSNCAAGAGGRGGNAGTGIGGPRGGSGGNGGSAGAIGNGGLATVSLVSCTVVNNLSGAGGAPGQDGMNAFPAAVSGALGTAGGMAGPATLRNTIIARNNIYLGSTSPDISGAISTLGYNLIGDKTGGSFTPLASDLAGSSTLPVDPELGPLGNNGGATPTCRVLSLSMALNSGDPALTGTDQRGLPRSSGGAVDKGAFELQLDANADLSALTVSAGAFAPSFSPGIVSYSMTVANSVGFLSLRPVVANVDASISLPSSAAIPSNVDSTFALNVGSNAIVLNLTASDNFTTKTYTLTVTRQSAVNAPTASTGAASGITTTTATLAAIVNPQGSATTALIEYGTTVALGSSASVTLTPNNGTADQSASVNLTGLPPGTGYYYRISATNAAGTATGAMLWFQTLITPPAATTYIIASNVTTTTATLTGLVNPNGFFTTASIEYGTTTSYGSSINLPLSPAFGSTTQTVSANISSLIAGTTYHYRTTAVNGGGTVVGNDATFTTLPLPTAVLTAPTSIGSAGATLNATVTPNGSTITSAQFEYGLTTSYGSTSAAVSNLTFTQTVSRAITGLTQGTTYHYRLKGTYSGGTINSSDGTFTTAATATPPTATTTAATSIGTSTVTFNGTVNANGKATTVDFEYGLTTAYGSTVSATLSPNNGTTVVSVSAGRTGLTYNTTYHYRIKATNADGVVTGSDVSFTTLTPTPTVGIGSTNIYSSYATIIPSVNPNGVATTAALQYGLTTSYGSSIPITLTPNNDSNTHFVSLTLSSLTPGTTYHYRVTATSAGGTVNGTDQTFTTTSPGPLFSSLSATSITASTVTLNGYANSNGFPASVSFEYGTTTAYGASVLASSNLNTSGYFHSVTANVTGLTGNTLYHYRITGTNSEGTNSSIDGTFTTLVNTSTNADLSNIVVQFGTPVGGIINYPLTPAFSSSVTSYTSSVDGPFDLIVTRSDPAALVSINSIVGSSTSSFVPTGGSRIITIMVTAPNGTTTKTYTVALHSATSLPGWRMQHFSTSSNTGNAADTADADQDGISNLLEWTCGTNPLGGNPFNQSAARNGTMLEYIYTRSVAAGSAGATLVVECTTTLAANDWHTAGITETIISDDGTTQTVKASVPVPDGSQCFVRLRVGAPP